MNLSKHLRVTAPPAARSWPTNKEWDAHFQMKAAGTSEGAVKGWDTRGRKPASTIEESKYPLTGPQQRVETSFRQQILNDPEKFKARYRAKFGNILNADDAKELSGAYQKDRAQYAKAVHEPASWLVKQLYKEELAKEPQSGHTNTVVFTAGGAGVGKTSAIKNFAEGRQLLQSAHIVYDGTMGSSGSAIPKVQQALDAGKEVVMLYVHRNPEEAFDGVLQRATNMEAKHGSGRTVPVDEFAAQHAGVPQAMQEVQAKFKDNPKFAMFPIDNTSTPDKAHFTTLDKLPMSRSEEDIRSAVSARLEKAYAEGKISKNIYEASKSHKGSAVQGAGQGFRRRGVGEFAGMR